MDANALDVYERIYTVVLSIPWGKVAAYGQVAELAGLPGRARLVGRAMRSLPSDSGVPWHRVVNGQGGISGRGDPAGESEQRALLESEGIVFNENGRISFDEHGWIPDEDAE